MKRVQIDDELISRLGEFGSETVLFNKEGRLVGVYVPAIVQQRRWYEWAKGRHTEEELDRICNEPGEKTTAEVLKSLRKP
jgi:hypothetical protein